MTDRETTSTVEVILYITARSPRHQEAALSATPPGCDVLIMHKPSMREVRTEIADANYLLSERASVIDRATIAAGKKLRLIQRLGTLAHDIDVDAATNAGIPVCLWPLPGCILVAEHMLMQLLVVAKRLPDAMAALHMRESWHAKPLRTDENQFAYNWTGQSGINQLFGKQIGILGFGEIGVEFARRVRGFCATVKYYKRNKLPDRVEQELGIAYAEPEEIYTESDYVCSLLPYSRQTDLSLNAATFASMKRGAYLVSCGSGSIVDEHALADALESGHLAGAALDTFEFEPLPPEHRLAVLARNPSHNLVLTPHTAAGTGNGRRDEEYTNVKRVRAGLSPFYQINDLSGAQ